MIDIFIGPPGSGKGTQAKTLAEKRGVPHISLGDILRAEVKRGTAIGRQAKALMDAGKLVPDVLTIELARQRIGQPDAGNGFIIDGFPRSLAQAAALDQMLAEKKLNIDRVVYFRLPEEEAVKRLLLRAGIEGRADDNAAAIRTRFEVYEQTTRPLIEYYQRMGKLKEIDAARPIDQVFQQLL